jgi:xylan 1,4-beta-xylosidase
MWSKPMIRSALLALALSATIANAAPTTATFTHFTYQGSDPVDAQVKAAPGQYRNPILNGFYPDPSVTRVGKDYYLVNSTFAYFPGIPVFHSTDLVHWTQIGNAIDRPGMLDFKRLGLSRAVFAPAIEQHDGTFYILNTCVDCGGNFLITAKDPKGPWSDPVWLPTVGGIDASLFFDDDGKAWILNNDNATRARRSTRATAPSGSSNTIPRARRPRPAHGAAGQGRRSLDQADLARGAAYPQEGRLVLPDRGRGRHGRGT